MELAWGERLPIRTPNPPGMQPDLAWLTQHVPLWALLVAMLTNPYAWSDRLTKRLTPLLNKLLPTQG